MRLSVKIAFAIFIALAIFQMYSNLGSLLVFNRFRFRLSDNTVVSLRTRGANFTFSLPKPQQISKSQDPEQPKISSSFVYKMGDNSSSSPPGKQGKTPLLQTSDDPRLQSLGSGNFSVPALRNETLPDSSLQNGDSLLPVSQSQASHPLSPAEGESLASVLQGTRSTQALQTLSSNLSLNDPNPLSVQISNAGVQQKPSGSLSERPEGERSAGEIVQDSKKLLLSSVPGKVKLPVVTYSSKGDETLPACPDTPPNLLGSLRPVTQPQTAPMLEQRFTFLTPGGNYRPPDCRPLQRLAIIVPYRNRWGHLHVLLNNLVPFLVRQQASFTIFIIEQEPPSTFNRALLLNVGVLEASLRDMYTCFIFHDVDLIPLNDRNMYRCRDQPKHFAVGINKFHYNLPYAGYFGGVAGLSREQVEKINGNSNVYFGWGGEDDELLYRVQAKGMSVVRDPVQIARYDMFKHNRDHGNEPNPVRFQMLKTTKLRMDLDGLNSLKYNVTSVELKPLYTWIKVKVDPQQFIQNPAATKTE